MTSMLSIGPLRTSKVGQRNVIARLTTYIRCIFQRHFRFGIFVCLVFQKHTWKCLIHHNVHCLDGYLDLAHVSVRNLTLIVLIGRRSHPVDNHVLPMWRLPYYKSIEELCYILFCKAPCKASSRQISIHFQSFISFRPSWRIRVHICLWVSALLC
jgi:hypothetical protein